jgi:hypothetical protein
LSVPRFRKTAAFSAKSCGIKGLSTTASDQRHRASLSILLNFGGLFQTGGLALTKSVEGGNLSFNNLVVDIFRIRGAAVGFRAL